MTDTSLADSPLRAALEELGAAFADVGGRAVVRHFGDTAAEYRAVREGVGIAERADRARIRMWGKDPAKMLHGMITNDLLKAPEGQGVYAAMLTAKGRTLAELRVFRRPSAELLIEIPREALAGTVEHLRKFVPPMFARWADASDEVGELGAYGPHAAALVERVLGVDVSLMAEDGFTEVEFGGVRVMVAGTRYVGGEPGFDLFAPSAALPALWAALLEPGMATPVGLAAIETLRIEAGRPRYGADLTEEVIPTEAFEETGMMKRAISFTKGCYTGQEVIVRIAHRGHVNRHLRGFLLGDGPAPAAGTPIFRTDTGKEAGRLTSVAFSPMMGQGVALGFARRELEPGAEVRVGAVDGPAAKLVRLPFQRGVG
ncbi:MAG TPA: glycine cleavage T C-terminal barrel domain-containing protein [Longimicrobium sp.]|jgi:folate-binding protein YgfZ